MNTTDVQQQIRGSMPLLRYMRAQALLVYLCRKLEITHEPFDPCWIMIPQVDLDRILIRLGYAWNERRRLYIAYQPVSSAVYVRLSSTLPQWFADGVLLARMAKQHADG